MPLLFLQDVSGFMVGKDAEQSGIIRSGAKMVNTFSNSTVPKITLITGGSFGAGNYAMCGKAFDRRFIFAWPHSKLRRRLRLDRRDHPVHDTRAMLLRAFACRPMPKASFHTGVLQV